MATTYHDMDKSDLHMWHEDTVSLVKSIITSEFRELKRDLSINNASSKSSCLKRKYVDDAFVSSIWVTRNSSIFMLEF